MSRDEQNTESGVAALKDKLQLTLMHVDKTLPDSKERERALMKQFSAEYVLTLDILCAFSFILKKRK